MPSEAQIDRIEQFFEDIRRLGGQAEQTAILTNLTVIDAAPVGLTGRIIIQDPRDGDFIPALTVPGINYNTGDLVNVLFVAGTEPVAYQQGSGSGTANVQVDRLWESDFAAVAWSTDATGNLSAAGAYNITSTGDLNINDINASGNVLLSAGGAIIGGTGSSNPTIGASASGNRVGNVYMASATFINGLGTLDISSGAIGSDITMVALANAAQDTLDLGDVAGTGDVDIDFSNGQMFLEGSSGMFIVGSSTPAGSNNRVYITQTHTDHTAGVFCTEVQFTANLSSAATAQTYRALNFQSQIDGSGGNTGDGTGVVGSARYNQTSGTLGTLQAASFDARVINAGSVTNGYGYRIIPLLSSSGNMTNWRAIEVRSPSVTGAGSITTAYGIRIEQQEATGVGTGWGVYQVNGADDNYFEGATGVGTSSISAKLHVDQSSTTAAIPVLYLDQADISEEMIEFNTTIGVGNAIEAVGAKTLTPTHFIKVTLPGGLTRYFEVGTIA